MGFLVEMGESRTPPETTTSRSRYRKLVFRTKTTKGDDYLTNILNVTFSILKQYLPTTN